MRANAEKITAVCTGHYPVEKYDAKLRISYDPLWRSYGEEGETLIHFFVIVWSGWGQVALPYFAFPSGERLFKDLKEIACGWLRRSKPPRLCSPYS